MVRYVIAYRCEYLRRAGLMSSLALTSYAVRLFSGKAILPIPSQPTGSFIQDVCDGRPDLYGTLAHSPSVSETRLATRARWPTLTRRASSLPLLCSSMLQAPSGRSPLLPSRSMSSPLFPPPSRRTSRTRTCPRSRTSAGSRLRPRSATHMASASQPSSGPLFAGLGAPTLLGAQ